MKKKCVSAPLQDRTEIEFGHYGMWLCDEIKWNTRHSPDSPRYYTSIFRMNHDKVIWQFGARSKSKTLSILLALLKLSRSKFLKLRRNK